MNEYYLKKAQYAKKLYEAGLPWVKVYAVIRDGENFVVLEREKNGKVLYELSGGGVDDGESLEEAIKREVSEETNMEVEVIKEIGVYDKLIVPWTLDNVEYKVKYEIHVLETKLIKENKGDIGLNGEFNNSVKITRINQETLLAKVVEFNKFNIKL